MGKEVGFDLIVIGAGSGLEVSSAAAAHGWKVAVVEEGPFGGTCLNRGCIPSKMYIHVADVAQEIQEAGKLGLAAKVTKVDWNAIIKRVTGMVDEDADGIEQGNRATENITVFKGRGVFVGMKKLQVGKHVISAPRIIIAAGSRPSVPPIPGLNKVKFITSDEALRLKKQPKSIIFIGGGYIACELAHFFGTLGTKVTILQRSDILLGREDAEIAGSFTQQFSERFDVRLNTEIVRVKKAGTRASVVFKEGKKTNTVTADVVMVATGRKPNTDTLNVVATGVALDKNGSIHTDDYLRTNVEGIWALGDIAGKWMFKHSANLEAAYVINNLLGKKLVPVDYAAMPHAVFSSPQLAGVGLTEEECRSQRIPYLKGIHDYKNTGYGAAMREEHGFVKVLVHPRTDQILGCHIVGPYASILIHEVLVAMRNRLPASAMRQTVHVHPALSEVVQRAFGHLQTPD